MTTTTPKYGFTINFAQRENGWMGPLHETQQKLDTLMGLRVKSMTTTAQPGSPANGDAYWTPTGATGGWTANRINVYLTNKPVNPTTVAPVTPTSGFYSIEAKPGLLMIVEDQSDALYAYGTGGWVATGVAGPFLYKAACRVVATSNVDETTGGLLTIDDIVLAAGDRVLLTGQTAAAENGLYVAAAGAWARAADADVSAEVVSGMLVPVSEGTANSDSLWLLTTNNPITLNTTALAFTKYGTLPTASTSAIPDTLVLRDAIAGFAAGPCSFLGDGVEPGVSATGSSADGNAIAASAGSANGNVVAASSNIAAGSATVYTAEIINSSGTHTGDAFSAKKGAQACTGRAYRVDNNGTDRGGINFEGEIGAGDAPTAGYDLTGKVGKFLSKVANGASAVGFDLVTQALSTAGALALRIKNNTTTLFTLDKDGNGVFTGRMLATGNSGTWANMPTASAALVGQEYLVMDYGVSGIKFRCWDLGGSTYGWKQIGIARLFSLTANVAINSTTETSIFGTGVGSITLPNGCLAIGAQFDWGFDALGSGGSGLNSYGYLKFKEYIGATAVGDSGVSASIFLQGTKQNHGAGRMVVRTLGASGTVMGSGMAAMLPSNNFGADIPGMICIASDAATTADTTGTISPDVKITLSGLVNSPTLTVDNSWLDVSGLVK